MASDLCSETGTDLKYSSTADSSSYNTYTYIHYPCCLGDVHRLVSRARRSLGRGRLVSGLSVLEKRLARETRYRLTYSKFDENTWHCVAQRICFSLTAERREGKKVGIEVAGFGSRGDGSGEKRL